MGDKAYSFSYSDSLLLEFKQLLRRHGIDVESGSKLDQALDSVLQVILRYLEPQSGDDQTAQSQEHLRDLVGVHDLVSKIIQVQGHENFEELVPHLRKLNKSAVLYKNLSLYLASLSWASHSSFRDTKEWIVLSH
jgi:hypothetical protein